VTDYDTTNGVLSVTKARVAGIDRDRTKVAEDRRVVLCPRARSVLDCQLKLRERLARAGRVTHQYLFFHPNGDPIRKLATVYRRWRQTLQRLAIRYRKPYAARHSSVSWDLMLGRNPLFVAQQHGHHILTMLTVYAAWTEGSLEADVSALRRAMRAPALAARNYMPRSPESGNRKAHSGRRSARQKIRRDLQPAGIDSVPPATALAVNLPMAKRRRKEIITKTGTWANGEGGITRRSASPLRGRPSGVGATRG